MIPIRSRAAARVAQSSFRASRPLRVRQQIRFDSSQSSSSSSTASQAASNHYPAAAAGAAGGVGVFLLAYLWYQFSGVKTAVQYSNQAQNYVKSLTEKAKSSMPKQDSSADEVIQWFRKTAHSYTGMIPGASSYIDSAFDDVDKVREKHGDEVDKILKSAKDQLVDVTNKPVSFERVAEIWTVISDAIRKITSIAGDSIEDIIDNHPTLKEKVGPRINDLKRMGDQYGPEAKKMVDDTWKEVSGILAGGISIANFSKLQDLIQRKTDDLRKFGDQAWSKGLEQVQPLLDKYPELKPTLEQNKDALLSGDLGQLWDKVRKASESGNVDDLKTFVQQQVSSKSGDVKKFGDEAYSKALEYLKPILDKSPDLKKTLEENKDALLHGDISELTSQARKAAESGNSEKLQSFIQEQLKEFKGFGDQAWQKGMEKAKPILDRVPELKEKIERNKEKLEKVDLGELWDKVVEAGRVGNTAPLERWLDGVLKKK